jgi:hypothetical protein
MTFKRPEFLSLETIAYVFLFLLSMVESSHNLIQILLNHII